MPYTPTSWTNGSTALNQTHLNNLETQYTEASLSFGPDFFTAGFVLTGYNGSKDGVTLNKLNVSGGTAYCVQADGTTRQRKNSATSQTTSTPSTTYYLFLNTDGTFTWGTSSSGPANSVSICQATTDGSGNILVVTDARPLAYTLFPGAGTTPRLALTRLYTDAGLVQTDGLGTLSISAPAAPGTPSAAAAANTTSQTYDSILLGLSPIRYYKLNESSGTVVTDFGSQAQNGTTHAAPTQAVTGLLNSDLGTCYTFVAASSQYVSFPTTSLPSGNGSWTVAAWVKFASNPAANAVIAAWGTDVAKSRALLYITSGGVLNIDIDGSSAGGGAALSTGTPHLCVGTYDGTTLKCYLDGQPYGTNNTPGTLTLGSTYADIGSDNATQWYWGGQIEKVAIFSSALTPTNISNLYTIGNNGPDSLTLPGVGTYKYTVTFATATSETVQSAQASVTTTAGNQKVSLSSIPLGPYGTTKRNIYRTVLGGSVEELLTALADNVTTTYTDSTPDSSLGAAQGQSIAGSISAPMIASLGGQASAGSFGVPVIVAQALDVHVTVTTTVTVLSFTPSATGLYRISGHVSMGNGNAESIQFFVQYTDPHLGGPTAYFSLAQGTTAPKLLAGSNSIGPSASVPVSPITIWAQSGHAITVQYLDPAGTPADFVTAIIERMA